MDAESIAGLVGLGIGLAVLLALSIFETRTYRREHGEGMLHHWVTHQNMHMPHMHMPHWMRRRH